MNARTRRMDDRFRWASILASLLILLLPAGQLTAQVPTPESVIGWEPGADYELADYSQIEAYFQALDEASDRIQLRAIGESVQGRTLYLALISSEENLEKLDRWKEIARRLAMARDVDEDEARALASEGKAILWVDGGLHATEVAHGQMTPKLAHHLVTSEEAEVRRIRDEAVVLLMPNMNPDGLDIVANWYRANLGTEFETAELPVLYHEYVGHDNNRDWFMILQPETEAVTRQLWHEWFPQIVYNHHQTGPFPSRIFVPPFTDPMNPRIPPMVMRGINLVGTAMGQRFDREGKPGVVSRVQYSVWWNGGMRTAPYFHNQIGILTETNLYEYATPHYYDPAEIPETFGGRRGGTLSAKEPSVFYPNPWKGGWWRIGDAVDYMMTGSMAVLDIGARLRDDWLYGIWEMGDRAIEAGAAGDPYAYVIPREQWDAGAAHELVSVLRRGAVEVHETTASFRAGGEAYPAGTFVAFAAQPFRAHLLDLMEPQVYPDRRAYPGGPPDPPYDLAGWTLPMQMGVEARRIDEPFQAPTRPVEATSVAPPEGAVSGSGPVYLLTPRRNDAFRAVLGLQDRGVTVARATGAFEAGGERWPAGTYLVRGGEDVLRTAAREHALSFTGVGEPSVESVAIRAPRVGLYKSWVANMDEGWTRWLLERYGVHFDTLDDARIRSGDLSGYDAVLLPDQDTDEILRGHEAGTMPEEFTGGVGAEGAAALKAYVEAGGTLIALDQAADFAIRHFGLPVRNAVRDVSEDRFFIPGSLIRARVDASDPLGWGMREEAAVSFQRSRAFQIVPPARAGERSASRNADVVVRYAEEDLLMSGWELGAREYLGGEPAVVRTPLGDGQVVLFGFRPQFRGQPHGTFKLLFNSILLSTMEPVPSAAQDGEFP